MSVNNANIIEDILSREGGWVDNPADHGGPTNLGITLSTLRTMRPGATVDDLKSLTKQEAGAIYESEYIIAPGFNVIDHEGLRGMCADAAVNHGPQRATILLQRALAVTPDGVFGNATRAALATAFPRLVLAKMVRERMRFYARIVKGDVAQVQFLEGWLNRCAEFVELLA